MSDMIVSRDPFLPPNVHISCGFLSHMEFCSEPRETSEADLALNKIVQNFECLISSLNCSKYYLSPNIRRCLLSP